MYMKYIEHIMYEGYTLITYSVEDDTHPVIGTISSGIGTPVLFKCKGVSTSAVLGFMQEEIDRHEHIGITPYITEMSDIDKIISYNHHGRDVFVKSSMKGRHRDICLCFAGCAHFKPNEEDNCTIAQENFNLCKKHGTVQPVLECPKYHKSHE